MSRAEKLTASSSCSGSTTLEFYSTELNPLVLRVTHLLLPACCIADSNYPYSSRQCRSSVDFIASFKQVKSAFLWLFVIPARTIRCMVYLLSRIVPQVARQQKISLPNSFPLLFMIGNSPMGWSASRLAILFGWNFYPSR